MADNLGRPADIGLFFDLNGNQLGATDAIVRTNGSGVAQVIYLARRGPTPPATRASSSPRVPWAPTSTARSTAVRLELRSAEPRIFPQVPAARQDGAPPPPFCNNPPNGSFISRRRTGSRRVGNPVPGHVLGRGRPS